MNKPMTDMTAFELVESLQNRGVQLWVEDNNLRFKAPKGVLTSELKSLLSFKKPDVIDLLNQASEETVLTTHPEDRFEPFPLTDLQLAYIVGRRDNYELGGVGCHSYIELEMPRLDHARLEKAWHKLIMRHDMLRAVIDTNGQQQVLKNYTLPSISCDDTKGQPEEVFRDSVTKSREEMAYRRYDSTCWPLYELRLTQHDSSAILHHSTDLLIADFASIQLLLAELGDMYLHPEKEHEPLQASFRDVVLYQQHSKLHQEDDSKYQLDKNYWQKRIRSLPGAPELPVNPNLQPDHLATGAAPSFKRLSFELPEVQWKMFSQIAKTHQITPSSAVMNAFAEVLQRWSRNDDFCINLTLLNRKAPHPDVNRIVGDFIAVNVLEVNGLRGENFKDRSAALQHQLWQDLEHDAYTGVEVLRDITKERKSNTLIPVVYTSTVGVGSESLPQNDFMHNAKLNFGITQTPQVWLDCQVTERRGLLFVDWDIRSGVFLPGAIEQAFDAFKTLLATLATSESHWGSHKPVSLHPESKKLREQLNTEKDTSLPSGYLHESFCQHVIAAPNEIALVHDTQTPANYTYRELAEWSLSIADTLIDRGLLSGEPVAIFMDKGPKQIAAVLGVLLAGGAYVPIDVIQPEKRRNTILEDARIRLVLTSSDTSEVEWPSDVNALFVSESPLLESQSERLEDRLSEIIKQGQQANTHEQLAYILYTSGTTGRPKGVMLTHEGVSNTIAGFNREFGITASDRTLALVNFSFDLSVLDIFCTFSAGATLVIPGNGWRNNPEVWARTVQNQKVTIWNSVPAHMQMLMAWHENNSSVSLSTLRLAFISGDWIPVTLPPKILAALPNLNLNSLGGPTEISVTCISNRIMDVPDGATSIPYGLPLSNHRLYVQNTRFEDCPDWVPGEMLVGGPGVAKGFINDPTRTEERFIIHPETGERMYRTGDICRYRPDGVIEILGRQDNQIKIRGHRIELGEVEAALSELSYIKQGVALVKPEPLELVCAIVLDDSESEETNGESSNLLQRVQEELSSLLPGYMIPSQVLVLDSIPLSSNGKVDRNTLKEHFSALPTNSNIEELPLETPLELKLADIWKALLKVEHVQRTDDFFLKGGSSLSAVELLNRLSEAGFIVNIDMIFNNAVFDKMVGVLEASEDAEEAFRQSIDLDQLCAEAFRNLPQALPLSTPTGKPQNLFMTGATGYLGVYILKALLDKTEDTLYCLVRCQDEATGYERIRKVIADQGLDWELDTQRIKIIPGDLTLDHYGISDSDYDFLAQTIDKVVHIAALISLIAPLSDLYPINVKGSANAIELATTGKIKPIHYMSTIGVHYRLPYEENEPPVLESVAPDGPWHKPELTYEHTKYMAEQIFYRAREKGVPVNIYRSGAITWDNTLEKPFINDDAFVKFFRTCLSVGAYPESRILISTTPVNIVADSIAEISKMDVEENGKNFHVVSRQSHTGEQIYRWLNELGCNFKSVDFATWDQQLADSFGRGFINRYFKHGMEQGGHHQYRIDNTESALALVDKAPHIISQEYFKPLVAHYQETIKRVFAQPYNTVHSASEEEA
ncbi:non-ribosomal peptide synthetase [Grimontia marina]|uniref:Phenyloxazoline synthase MbtB n=1 Tax=Grimontia marina TaxID=646534 RepID=A0A128F7E1_9GAMM|nr:non-ribosomal peptide synthetase [Grimontia marina]CZF82415.1 Phenyloxazoline synthase MbtB [Grimontia marina]